MSAQWFLGVETSTSEGSLALFNKSAPDKMLESSWSRTHSHSEVITTKSHELFENAGIKPSGLSGIVCGCGPGSFTGIRVAINFARSLAYANDLPVWTVNTLENLAWQARQNNTNVLAGCEAFRDLIYVAGYTDEGPALKEILKPQAITAEQLCQIISQPFVASGRGLHLYWDELSPIHDHLTRSPVEAPTARAAIEATVGLSSPPPPLVWNSAKPLYIRASEAEEKLKSGELKPQKSRY